MGVVGTIYVIFEATVYGWMALQIFMVWPSFFLNAAAGTLVWTDGGGSKNI